MSWLILHLLDLFLHLLGTCLELLRTRLKREGQIYQTEIVWRCNVFFLYLYISLQKEELFKIVYEIPILHEIYFNLVQIYARGADSLGLRRL